MIEGGIDSNLKTHYSDSDNRATIEEEKSYINPCASILRENYNGYALTLESFLDNVDSIRN